MVNRIIRAFSLASLLTLSGIIYAGPQEVESCMARINKHCQAEAEQLIINYLTANSEAIKTGDPRVIFRTLMQKLTVTFNSIIDQETLSDRSLTGEEKITIQNTMKADFIQGLEQGFEQLLNYAELN